jgi:hypothetical protein
MSYVLRLAVHDRVPEVPITEEQAAEARRARRTLDAAFALEETYDLLVSNFLELDQEALCAAARRVVRDSRTYEEFFEERACPNRRIVNLLTSARLYLDHVPQHLAECTNTPDNALEEFRKITAIQYDSRFSYRFMEALRNHVQHSGLAVHVVSHNSQWSGRDHGAVYETRLSLFSKKEHFEENKKFHKKTLAEMPDSVELLHASREYLEGLGTVHDRVRMMIETAALEARWFLQGLIESYASVNDGGTLGLSVMRVQGNKREKVTPVFLQWDDVRLGLITRNTTLSNLSSRVATSRLGILWRPD